MELTDITYQEDGSLVWNKTKGRAVKGQAVGWSSKDGYLEAQVSGKRYKVHHIVWKLHHGFFPDRLDHINGNRTDNRISNLRQCSVAENSRNRKNKEYRELPRNIYYYKTAGKYRVCLMKDGKAHSFGVFDDLSLAETIAKQARELYFGEFSGN